MRFLCRIGCHKFDKRVVHIDEPIKDGQKEILASIIECCECGAKRFAAFSGGSKPTSFYIPSQYKED